MSCNSFNLSTNLDSNFEITDILVLFAICIDWESEFDDPIGPRNEFDMSSPRLSRKWAALPSLRLTTFANVLLNSIPYLSGPGSSFSILTSFDNGMASG